MMRRFAASPAAGPGPMAELNITPLIDVMLVLLVMFIITIPAMTHEVPVDLPSGRGAADPLTRRLEVTRGGAVRIDGRAVADAALPARLAAIRAEAATLVMRTDPAARYERFDQVLSVVKHAGITRLGFEGHAAMVE